MKVPRKTILLGLLLLADLESVQVTHLGTEGTRVVAPTSLAASTAEFPPQDERIWLLQREGLTRKIASEQLVQAPGSVRTFDLLVQVGRIDDALRVLRRIIGTTPEQIAAAFQIVIHESVRFHEDQSRGHGRILRELATDAGRRAATLPREQAAVAARVLLEVENWLTPDRREHELRYLREFAQQYSGTEAAVLAEIDVAVHGVSGRARIDLLDSFARRHSGSIAGARALYLKGFHLHASQDDPKPGADPTDRLIAVLSVVQELESGRHPRCIWTELAPRLVTEFYAYEPTYAPRNLDRMLAGYEQFARTHFVLPDVFPLASGVGYVIAERMAELLTLKGEGPAGIERVLARLEREPSISEPVRYLRALYLTKRLQSLAGTAREGVLRKTRTALEALHDDAAGLYQRKALATLAALDFTEHDYTRAHREYRTYLKLYPKSEWAWVAALRAAQCEELLGDWKAALGSHRQTAIDFEDVPIARALGHAYAARAHEALGQFSGARDEYARALRAWDTDYGQAYSLFLIEQTIPDEPFLVTDRSEVTPQLLRDRIDELRRSIAAPGGDLLERGRWLVQNGQRDKGMAIFHEVTLRHPESAAATTARYLLHRALLDRALESATVESAGFDEAAALSGLEALGREPFDFAVFAAKIAKAGMLWQPENPTDAEALMAQALDEWRAHQAGVLSRAALTALEKDVAESATPFFDLEVVACSMTLTGTASPGHMYCRLTSSLVPTSL